MESIIYKPHKKQLEAWNSSSDNIREINGRKLLSVEIGKKIYMDTETKEVSREEFVYEEIFLDVILGIFKNKASWATKITLSHEPKLVISYENKLVVHNDKMSEYIEDILNALREEDKGHEIKSLINAVLNEKAGTKYLPEFHSLVDRINEKCNANYPAELVSLVLKEYLCEEERDLNEMQEKLHFMSYEELLNVAGKVLTDRYAGKTGTGIEASFKEELMFRFIQGDLS